ncbi:alpha/beta hydrolase [Paenisporosarcina cavernae]|uniref:Alpha/beta fold hydrolase n=1 Tax=Paenisporosarcina cavernae TaxID=2320858 RepID=A0A385YV68_9BACL|nr:alpha/beta fold hydrolase [Paenisporosarcina cavernae]AYC30371.1 alpha/beta fold hydrolase [Paenisporosarcina cavernae]
MTTGVLCIHGFTGGPYEVLPFAHYLREKTDWTIAVPTLPGHGSTLQLKNWNAENWLMEAETAYRNLSRDVDRVIVVGFSMGGLIALYLAMRYPVHKLVLLSAAAKYISPAQMAQDMKEVAKDVFHGKVRESSLLKQYRYKWANTPLRATMQFLRVAKLVRPYYAQINPPVCIVQGKLDGIVPFTSAHYLFEQLGSTEKKLIFSETGKHHICYSDDCEDWFASVFSFLEKEN